MATKTIRVFGTNALRSSLLSSSINLVDLRSTIIVRCLDYTVRWNENHTQKTVRRTGESEIQFHRANPSRVIAGKG